MKVEKIGEIIMCRCCEAIKELQDIENEQEKNHI